MTTPTTAALHEEHTCRDCGAVITLPYARPPKHIGWAVPDPAQLDVERLARALQRVIDNGDALALFREDAAAITAEYTRESEDIRAGAALASALMAANYGGDSGEDVDRLVVELLARGYRLARLLPPPAEPTLDVERLDIRWLLDNSAPMHYVGCGIGPCVCGVEAKYDAIIDRQAAREYAKEPQP